MKISEFYDIWEGIDLWTNPDHLFEECIHVLVRLAGKREEVLVLLWDLLYAPHYDKFLIVKQIFNWAVAEVEPPMPYDPDAGTFTVIPSKIETIRRIVADFDDWKMNDPFGRDKTPHRVLPPPPPGPRQPPGACPPP